MTTLKPILVRQDDVCSLIDRSRSGLDKLRKRDPSFPKPIKQGNTRQAAVYYVLAEIEDWIEASKASRKAAA